ncbi:hypothetical protein O5631_04530 [Escherichia coli]|nr:hypothetical protein [Escherichia coli]
MRTTTRNQTAKAADVTFVAAMQGELLADRTQALVRWSGGSQLHPDAENH